MPSIKDEIEAAAEVGRRSAEQKGLLVLNGETPTPHQAALAALHAREDAAACMFLLARVMQRQETLQRWIYFVVVLLVLVLVVRL